MEALVLDGKRFIKASKAARLAGYTQDYVGQLCRARKIKAKLVGRSWYVDEEELRNYKSEAKRTSRQKAREQVRASVRHIAVSNARELPHRARQHAHYERKAYERRIAYEKDQSELLPPVRKIAVETEVPPNQATNSGTKEKPYEIEHEGEKVLMSGDLTVVDANDDAPDADTVVLTPKIVRTKKEQKPERTMAKQRIITTTTALESVRSPDVTSSKVQGTGGETVRHTAVELPIVDAQHETGPKPGHLGTLCVVAILVLALTVSVALILARSEVIHEAGGAMQSRYSLENIDFIYKIWPK